MNTRMIWGEKNISCENEKFNVIFIGFVDSEYGHGSLTELTYFQVPGTCMEVLQKSQKFRVLWHGRTDITEVRGTGMNGIRNSQKPRVRV